MGGDDRAGQGPVPGGGETIPLGGKHLHLLGEEADLYSELVGEDARRVWEQAMPPCMLEPGRGDLGVTGPEDFINTVTATQVRMGSGGHGAVAGDPDPAPDEVHGGLSDGQIIGMLEHVLGARPVGGTEQSAATRGGETR